MVLVYLCVGYYSDAGKGSLILPPHIVHQMRENMGIREKLVGEFDKIVKDRYDNCGFVAFRMSFLSSSRPLSGE